MRIPTEMCFSRIAGRFSVERCLVAQVHPTVDSRNHGRLVHEYCVFTAQEMVDHLKCAPEAIYDCEVAGNLFALLASDRVNCRRWARSVDSGVLLPMPI